MAGFLVFSDRAQALAHPVCICGAPRQPQDGALDWDNIPPLFSPLCADCRAEADHPNREVSRGWDRALIRQYLARGLL